MKLIRKFPLLSFLLLSLFICYAFLFGSKIFPQSSMPLQVLRYYFSRIGTYSPAIAGVFVAYVMQPQKVPTSKVKQRIAFFVIWIFATAFHGFQLSFGAPKEASLLFLVLISMPVAVLPASLVALAFSRSRNVRRFLESLRRPGGAVIYYLIAVFCFPLVHYLGLLITSLIHGSLHFPALSISGRLAFILGVEFFTVLFFSGGLNEETGWRGFAQKSLQGRFSPLLSNLFLWGFLVIWHIPNDLVQYEHGGYWLVRFGVYPSIVIIFGWIYNRSRGSILVPAIFHASMNMMNLLGSQLPMTKASNLILVAVSILVILSDKMWKKPQNSQSVEERVGGQDSSAVSESSIGSTDAQFPAEF